MLWSTLSLYVVESPILLSGEALCHYIMFSEPHREQPGGDGTWPITADIKRSSGQKTGMIAGSATIV